MKKVLVALGLALTMVALFPVAAAAGSPPPNVGRQYVPPLTRGATADSIHASQETADQLGIPLGLHFVEYFNDNGLIPGHVTGFHSK